MTDRAAHYRDRAQQLRDIAEHERDEDLRRSLLELAEECEKRADELGCRGLPS